MSEQHPSAEYESRSMSEVMKYYYSLQRDSITEDNAFMAVCMLIESLPDDRQPPLSLLIEHDAMPAGWLYDADQSTVMEKLALMPLTYLSPLLEASDYPLENLKKWNHDVLLGLRIVTLGDHDERCLRYDPDCKYDQCQTSLTCPRRAMKRFVKEGVTSPDFSSPSYRRNHERAYRVTTDKLDIGIEQMIIHPSAAKRLRMVYDMRYQGWLHDRRPTSSDTV